MKTKRILTLSITTATLCLFGCNGHSNNEVNKKIIFLTEPSFNGNLGGLAGANQLCNDEAKRINLTGNFKALLQGNKATKINQTYYNLSESVVATATTLNLIRWGDNLENQILTESQSIDNNTSGLNTWTGTTPDGIKGGFTGSSSPLNSNGIGSSCNNWTYDNADRLNTFGGVGGISIYFSNEAMTFNMPQPLTNFWGISWVNSKITDPIAQSIQNYIAWGFIASPSFPPNYSQITNALYTNTFVSNLSSNEEISLTDGNSRLAGVGYIIHASQNPEPNWLSYCQNKAHLICVQQ